MNKTLIRVGAAASAALASGLLFAPNILAEDSNGTGGGYACSITDNGARSRNRCRVKVTNKKTVVQVNSSKVKNTVFVVSNTGGNEANKNTGGNVESNSGNSTVTVTITNTGNTNTINP